MADYIVAREHLGVGYLDDQGHAQTSNYNRGDTIALDGDRAARFLAAGLVTDPAKSQEDQPAKAEPQPAKAEPPHKGPAAKR
jgi:hypothetical protein